MARLPKRYNPQEAEPRIQAFWRQLEVYHFSRNDTERPVYSIDTPPATVSGHLHLGHVYSYSHPDFIARYRRMQGANVFYPMGYDDNGLPTERLVEEWVGVRAAEVGRKAFIDRCLAVSERAESDYRSLWQRLGLSVDWRYSYRTIDALSQRTAQHSFLTLYAQGLAYRQEAPTIWCPTCTTAIAQAELGDLTRSSIFYTLLFQLVGGGTLQIATTRPELLPACVAIFVHPEDPCFAGLVGREALVPSSGHRVPILFDPAADPGKGSGAVMCCTFGDATDVTRWRTHRLPLRVALNRRGMMTDLAGPLAGLPAKEARTAMVDSLAVQGLLLGEEVIEQPVRVHERCSSPVEYSVTQQWFVRLLDHKAALLAAGEAVIWHPPHMALRYREWVEALNWDWCISRQRAFGVPFPVWICDACGTVITAEIAELPVDPVMSSPTRLCKCGSASFAPDPDVMDTWATSSLSPQIAGQWLSDPDFYAKVFPFSLHPQAHEIIRTWAFYSIVKSSYHFERVPWHTAVISGWGLAPEGGGKLSKSRGDGSLPPSAMVETYSADAVRYWAASAGFGKDAVISEEKVRAGAKLVTKLWNVARFVSRFAALQPSGVGSESAIPPLTPADRWILSQLTRLVAQCTEHLEAYDYASAKSEAESFFWQTLADNYLEMAKLRLYSDDPSAAAGASFALGKALLTVIKLFAPFLPHVTEELFQQLFANSAWEVSLHTTSWSAADQGFLDEEAEAIGGLLVAVATAVRRYKSEQALSLGSALAELIVVPDTLALAEALDAAGADLRSVTRAQRICIGDGLPPEAVSLLTVPELAVGVCV